MNDFDRLRQLAGLLNEGDGDDRGPTPEYRRWLDSKKENGSGDPVLTPEERATHMGILTDVDAIQKAVKMFLFHNPMMSDEDHKLINRFSFFLQGFMFPMALIKVKEKPGLRLRPRPTDAG